MIGKLAQALAECSELSAEEILDVLWLAAISREGEPAAAAGSP